MSENSVLTDSDRLPCCPRCSAVTVSAHGASPWCPACEWGLDRYEPTRRAPESGWQRVDRHLHRLAYRLTHSQFAALAQRPLGDPGRTRTAVLIAVASIALLTGVGSLAATGVWILVTYRLPAPMLVIGVALLGVAFALRPRFGRLDSAMEVLTPDRAPQLFALIHEVARTVGAPLPHVVGVDEQFNAYATSVGPRRRRVLCLGLPLWGSLAPQERVALLGHELGHFVNGDVRRTVFTQPAFTMLASAADLVRPVDTFATGGLAGMVGDAIGRAVQWVLHQVLFGGHLLLVCLALRESQRAEYLADELAVRAAGSAAAVGLLDGFLVAESTVMVVRREARAGHGPDRWRAAADEVRAANAGRLVVLRQLSIRDEVSVFASHPPNGLRTRMVQSRRGHEPAVTLTDDRAARIDTELARNYERTRRNLAWSS